MRRVHLVIHGVVQGVSFRWFTRAEAARLGLTGWVRNRPNGTVEAVAEGPDATLGELVAFCRRGPSGARVIRVEVTWSEATGEHASFEIRH
jgi:acylphosphatase